jgi:hypothetical protein
MRAKQRASVAIGKWALPERSSCLAGTDFRENEERRSSVFLSFHHFRAVCATFIGNATTRHAHMKVAREGSLGKAGLFACREGQAVANRKGPRVFQRNSKE